MLGRWVEAISARQRRRRMAWFVEQFGVSRETRILDVGGAPALWERLPVAPRVTLLNLPRAAEARGGMWELVYGDGCALPFQDGAFDIVFSNSVIEHVGGAEAQAAFAREVARVGKRYVVQTPNRFFPVETHLLTPLIHWLPEAWQRWVAPRFTVWSLIARARADEREFYLRHYLEEVRLLSEGELKRLFPDARIRKERFLFLTKSLIAYR